MKHRLIPAVLTLLLLGLLAACGDTSPRTPTPTLALPQVSPTPPAPVASSTPAATPTLTPAAPIAWHDCSDGWQCAQYDVPLDYSHPSGASITLSVRRLPASDQGQRIGALFANPGGPGGSAISILSGWARTLPSSIRSRFDIVLFDPRGVGESSPLLCHDNVQELIGLNPYPSTDADWKVIEDATRQQTMQCGDVGRGVLPFLGTESVARDMDRVREAMGDAQVTYFGYSYGTTIGQVYADLFPSHVRAMVLDGAVDIGMSADERALEQTIGFEQAFQRYLANCKATHCITGDPETTIHKLVSDAAEHPIPAPSGDRPVGAGEAIYAIIGSLYSRVSWSSLTSALNLALENDGSALLRIVDNYVGREPDGHYDNSTEMNSAVNCLDYVNDRNPLHYRELAADFEQQAPWFGAATGQLGLYCAYWEAEPRPLHVPKAEGAPPILVIGNTGDPATPYKWAVGLSKELATGVLLTNDGEGHTAYRTGVSCIDNAVNTYLLAVQPPPLGTECGSAGITPAPPVAP